MERRDQILNSFSVDELQNPCTLASVQEALQEADNGQNKPISKILILLTALDKAVKNL